MNEHAHKMKKISVATIKPSVHDKSGYSNAKTFACAPKNPPNISCNYSKQAKLREEGKQNRHKDNECEYVTSDRNKRINRPPNMLLVNRKSNLPQADGEVRIIKRARKEIVPKMVRQKIKVNSSKDCIKEYVRQFKPKKSYIHHVSNKSQLHEEHISNFHNTEWISSVGQESTSETYNNLGCNQHLNSLTFKSSCSQSRKSQLVDHQLQARIPYKQVQKTPQEELTSFENKIAQIKNEFEEMSLNYMVAKQDKYAKNLDDYIDSRQKNLSFFKRAVVIDWMMEFLSEISCKRQTLATAVQVLDRYLAVADPITIDQLQLIGAASMMIANKAEDNRICISVEQFREATRDQYTCQQILDTQLRILIKLKFFVTMPTINAWANRISAQWDEYLYSADTSMYPLVDENLGKIKLKYSDEQSYKNFRTLTQYIDFSILDIQTLAYKNRTLAASFIYILLAVKLGIYSIEDDPTTHFRERTNFIRVDNGFNDFFDGFLKFSFSIGLQQLLPTIQYAISFVILPLKFDMPIESEGNEGSLHFQEFCSIQIRNQNNKLYIKRRNRDKFW